MSVVVGLNFVMKMSHGMSFFFNMNGLKLCLKTVIENIFTKARSIFVFFYYLTLVFYVISFVFKKK